ncbi:translation initiation factor-like protein 1 [Elsinoe australis]|uniref:Translation initiation factor-like protein 1 n=1 Tax=Elsinoe australis TaxID=40998 RepID=A0A4U7AP35_9PEZI|nr:translation initiation factor-like protein 1 [Elsinoe australis]
MPKPRRNVHAAAEETLTPPDTLEPSQHIARVKTAAGNNLYHVELPDSDVLLVELAQRFRSTIWVKRGSYVLVDTSTLAARENKIGGEIINIVRDEKRWMKSRYWPAEFKATRRGYEEDSDEEESTMGKMPPSDSEEEG